MALLVGKLKAELQKIFDQESILFEGFPTDSSEVGQRWGDAIDEYVKTITPPSSTISVGIAAFSVSMSTISNQAANGLAVLTSSFATLAATIATGMAPAFVGVPPPSPIDFSPVLALGFGGGSSEACAGLMSQIIDTWFRTGTATPSAGGAPIPWS